MVSEPTVFVIDDDVEARRTLTCLCESVGLAVRGFSNAIDFLEAVRPGEWGCLLLDIRMPGMSGLELQEHVVRDGGEFVVIMVTGHADVPTAVRAMRAGALDLIEKPFVPQDLLDRVHHALDVARARRGERTAAAQFAARLEQLTAREREVFDLLVVGRSAKEIGAALQLSHKTVQVHRARILEKINVGSVAELLCEAVSGGWHPTKS
jgi:two-component system response regulator FixJ